MQSLHKKIIFFLIFLVLYYLQTVNIFAMDSSSYQVESDVLNESGGYTASSNYRILGNLGESITGVSSSDNYKIYQGFLTTEVPILNFSISNNIINLGTLTSIDTKTATTTLTVSTNAISGYNVRAFDGTPAGITNGLMSGIKKIADATTPNVFIDLPSSGIEHFGIVATGNHASLGYASGTKINSLDNTTWADIASFTGFISEDVITVQYRASISDATPASGNFQSIATYIATGNF
jgi:hypothetical protein